MGMGMIMIKCPQTGHAISTGLKADRDSFLCSAVFFARTPCSVCEVSHEWFSMQAWVDDWWADRRAPDRSVVRPN